MTKLCVNNINNILNKNYIHLGWNLNNSFHVRTEYTVKTLAQFFSGLSREKGIAGETQNVHKTLTFSVY